MHPNVSNYVLTHNQHAHEPLPSAISLLQGLWSIGQRGGHLSGGSRGMPPLPEIFEIEAFENAICCVLRGNCNILVALTSFQSIRELITENHFWPKKSPPFPQQSLYLQATNNLSAQ